MIVIGVDMALNEYSCLAVASGKHWWRLDGSYRLKADHLRTYDMFCVYRLCKRCGRGEPVWITLPAQCIIVKRCNSLRPVGGGIRHNLPGYRIAP